MNQAAAPTQQLAEFVAAVSGADNESAAALAAVERAAELLDADVAAIVGRGAVLAAVGYPSGSAPVAELAAVQPGIADSRLDVPGAGTCVATAVSLDNPSGMALVVARPAAHGLEREELALLRGMARVTSLTLRMLRLVDDERAAREEVERLAREQATLRRVATLVAEGASPEAVFSAVAREVAQAFEADTANVLRYEEDNSVTVMGAHGDPEPHLPTGSRFMVAGEGVVVSVQRTGRPARTDAFSGPPGSVADANRRAGIRTASGSPIIVDGRLWGVVIAGRRHPEPLTPEAERRLPAFTELVATAIANTQARLELSTVAGEQAALRRVATLVAQGEPPEVLFEAVAEEVGRVVPGAGAALVGRYDADEAVEFVGGWVRHGEPSFVGDRVSLGGYNTSTLVFEGNAPARVDHLSDEEEPVTALARRWARSSVGAPINAEGRLWGVMIVGSEDPGGLPTGIEHQLADFTELVATAIANAQAREELRAIADEQTALRRVATLVARAAPPDEVFAKVAEEVGPLFDADAAGVVRFDPDRAVTSVGSWNTVGPSIPGARVALGGHNVTTLVFETGQSARVDKYADEDSSPPTTVARGHGALSAVGAPIRVESRVWGALQVASSREAALPARTEERLSAFGDLIATAIANAQARDELRAIADEQAALRRVATLVASAAPPDAVFTAVADEVARLLPAEVAVVGRYGDDDTVTIIGSATTTGMPIVGGTTNALGGRNVSTIVWETGRAARLEDFAEASGDGVGDARTLGVSSTVGVPITVAGRLWGVMVVGATEGRPISPGSEQRMVEFTQLIATAIANAHVREELTSSRARIVTTADETRRRIERDLHDGAQQRLITLALQLRAAQAMVAPDLHELTAELDGVAAGLDAALEELREFARGIHPAILAEGGLAKALKVLARRSAVPVELDIRTIDRLPKSVEVGAYYFVSEALANAAKHADASVATVHVDVDDRVLQVSVRDDGTGGADLTGGSGLLGLKDRVEALGGQFSFESPRGAGTCLDLELPLTTDAVPAGSPAQTPPTGRR